MADSLRIRTFVGGGQKGRAALVLGSATVVGLRTRSTPMAAQGARLRRPRLGRGDDDEVLGQLAS
jgi:hypothetical protein